MINLHRIKKYICLVVLLLLCFLCSNRMAIGEENTVTMTEFNASEAARQSALAGKIVTISNLEEFRLFQRYLNESTDGLAGLSFRQEADITPGDYHFTYDGNVDRCWIDRGSDRVGAVDRAGVVYRADGFSVSSIEALGLSDLILQTWDDAKWFAGTYDGQDYFFRGFLLGFIDYQGSSYGGLFCDLGGGLIRNVNVSDCYMHYCMSPLVNAMNSGTICNCHVSNIVGAADCNGGIAGLLWSGSIQDCTVDHCMFQFRQGYQEGGIYGGLGGVVGILEQNSGVEICNCEVSDTIIHGADFSQVGTGGIAGIVNTSRIGSIFISDCSASVTIYGGRTAGGILGRVQKDGMGTVSIRDCVCSGSILEDADSSGSDVGGILGRAGLDVSQISITDCISQTAIEKCSEKRRGMGTAGGIVGSLQGNCVIDGAVFAGSIQEKETVGNRGQRNSFGGIVGEMVAAGTVINCVNFADISMGDLQDNICGGLVGLISTDQNTNVANSLTLGNITGKISGGLVGVLDKGEATYRIHNALSLGEVTGEITGNLAGEIATGVVTYCFSRDDMAQAFGNVFQGAEYCRQLSTEQLAGTEQIYPVFDTGDYAGIFSVREVLNKQADLVENQRKYERWENTQAGYPLMNGLENSLPFALRKLSGEWNPLPIVTKVPNPTSTPFVTEKPVPSPTVPSSETETPNPTASPSGTGAPDCSATPAPQFSAPPSSAPNQETNFRQQFVVTGFQGKIINNKSLVLTWKKNTKVTGYRIYRSVRKSSGYREIKKCNSATVRFRDKKCKPGKKYYYQIRAVYLQNGKFCQGRASRCTVKLPHLKTPTFRLSRGKNAYGEKYLQITMRKYAGNYVDVYLKKEDGRYLKASMASHRIAAYRGKIRFTYRRSGVKYWCKIRTYKIVKGKKCYSGYSRGKKIRL